MAKLAKRCRRSLQRSSPTACARRSGSGSSGRAARHCNRNAKGRRCWRGSAAPSANIPRTLGSGGRRAILAGPGAARRRDRQARLVRPLSGGGIAGEVRAHRAELGHREQACPRRRPGATELADFSVCTSWGIFGKHLYLIDVVRERFDYRELKRRVKDEHRRWRADVVLIEDKASGTQLIQELLDEGMHADTRYRPQVDDSWPGDPAVANTRVSPHLQAGPLVKRDPSSHEAAGRPVSAGNRAR
jgi:hypothetical protein